MEAVLDAGSDRSQDPGGHGLLTDGPSPGTVPGRHLLVYDGHCGFCRGSVEWALERDRRDRIEARPFQEPGVLERAGVTREQARRAAWLVAPDGRRWRGARAAGHVLMLLPGWKPVGRLLLLPGIRWLASLLYRWIADHRSLTSRLTGIGRSGDGDDDRSGDGRPDRGGDGRPGDGACTVRRGG